MSNKNNFFSIANNLENLEENKGYLIWIRCGAFFVAICANAVILSNILGLKRICIKQGVCKVGIPVNSIYDYIKKLERIGDSFVIYNYSKDEMVNKYLPEYKSLDEMKAHYEKGGLGDVKCKKLLINVLELVRLA